MSEFEIAAEDSSPIVIGGLGGSGTRLVTEIVQKEGVTFGGPKNDFLDNLWFSLLFVRRTILLKPIEEVRRLVWLFTNAMRHSLPLPDELLPLIEEAALHDRGPSLRKAVLDEARETLVNNMFPGNSEGLWGWKQPNSHILLPLLNQFFPKMKFIYVLRNGLDMAFSYNQNQLKYFWGDLLLEGDVEPSPRNALR
ncbi:MAG: sulfotransferase [Halioglobus sp.]